MNQNYYWLVPVFLLIVALLAAITILAYQYLLQQRKLIKLQAEADSMVEEFSRLEEELRITRIKAEESDRLKTAFLCNISHEIRTPLHAILGFSGLIANKNIGDSEKISYTRIINRNVDTLMEVMNDIFDVSQSESSMMQLNESEVNLNEMLSSVQTWLNFEKDIAGKDQIQVRIFRAAKDTEIKINTDAYKLKRILHHLSGNALKYSQQGFIDLGYQFSENQMIKFFVKDEGIGFSKDKLDYLFDSFRQVDETAARQYQGLGLGLALAQKFVSLLGGELWAESEPGKGSTFWFSMPNHKTSNTLKNL